MGSGEWLADQRVRDEKVIYKSSLRHTPVSGSRHSIIKCLSGMVSSLLPVYLHEQQNPRRKRERQKVPVKCLLVVELAELGVNVA